MRFRSIIPIILYLLFLFMPAPINAASINKGIGHSYASISDNYDAIQMINEAIFEAKSAYGSTTPKLLLVINNLGSWSEVISKIRDPINGFGSGMPLVGAGTNNTNYNSFTQERFVNHNNVSFAILALGGDSITNIETANTSIKKADGTVDYVHAGEELAKALVPHINADKNNIIHLFGPGHYDHNVQTLIGMNSYMSNTLGNVLSENIKIIGAGAYITGGSVFNDSYGRETLTAVLITGDFQMSARGIGEGFGSQGEVEVSGSLVSEVASELGGDPDVLFYVPGHPDQLLYEDVRLSVLSKVGSNTTIFGHEGGGEIGHCKVGMSCGSDLKDGTGGFANTTNGQPIAGRQHMFVLGLRSESSTVPTATPSATPAPTGVTALPGDANGDGKVDGLDYVVWLNNYNTNTTGGASKGDFDGNGRVDGLDYVIWLNNYGTSTNPTPTPVTNPTATPTGPTATPSSGAIISNLSVQDTTNAADWSIQTNIQAGDTQYGDRRFLINTLPSTLAGSEWVRTANDSKNLTGTMATFKLNSSATVYVAHNDLITTKPSWLSGYTDTGMNMVNSESTPQTFSVYSRSFSSGATVTLGENGGNASMYSVVLK